MPAQVRQGCVNACYYAQGRECDCACGGANHQAGFSRDGGVTRVIVNPAAPDREPVHVREMIVAGDSRPADCDRLPEEALRQLDEMRAARRQRDAGRQEGEATQMERRANEAADVARVALERERELRDRAARARVEREQRRQAELEAAAAAHTAAVAPAVAPGVGTEEERARISAVVEAQAQHPVTAQMVASAQQGIVARRRVDGADAGVNNTYRVQLSDGTVGYEKPADQPRGAQKCALTYGLTPAEQVTHEAAAYHLAAAMGPEYQALVPPTVVVHDPEHGVASIQQHAGRESYLDRALRDGHVRPGVAWWGGLGEVHSAEQLRRAGLFDAVIGHQDRHPHNFRVGDGGSLHLIDNGYAFKRPESVVNRSGIQEHRVVTAPEVTGAEREVLTKLRESPDLGGVAPMIGRARADAMRGRIDEMLTSGRVLPPSQRF